MLKLALILKVIRYWLFGISKRGMRSIFNAQQS